MRAFQWKSFQVGKILNWKSQNASNPHMKMFLMCVIKEKLGKHLDVIIELENETRII